jgi:hypothetical protein
MEPSEMDTQRALRVAKSIGRMGMGCRNTEDSKAETGDTLRLAKEASPTLTG